MSCASFDVREWSVAGHCESEDLDGVVGEFGQLFKNSRVRVDTGHFGKSHRLVAATGRGQNLFCALKIIAIMFSVMTLFDK